MLYEDIMTPIEMLNNIDRLPVLSSSIYDPHLLESFVIYPNNTPEYNEYLEDLIKHKYSFLSPISDTVLISPEITDLSSDPISACQFHVIKVMTRKHNI